MPFDDSRNSDGELAIWTDAGAEFGRVTRRQDSSFIGDLPADGEAEKAAGSEVRGFVGLTADDKRLRFFFAAVAAALILVTLRLVQTQIIQGSAYRRLAEGNRSRVELIPAERGIIYDRDGQPLVRNIPDFTLLLRPADWPAGLEGRAAVVRLAGILNSEPETVLKSIEANGTRSQENVVIGEHLTHDQAVLAAVENSRNPAITLKTGTRREYLLTGEINSLSHILGYEGRLTEEELQTADTAQYLPSDLIGKTGLEKSYEKELHGSQGRRINEIDALGQKKDIISEEASQPGRNLVLAIDADLQRQAEDSLKQELRAAGKKRGSVIALDPRTGEILALVSEPAFDANLFAQGIAAADYQKLAADPDHPLFPRAIAGLLPAGSTFKLAMASAALEEGTITPTTSVLSTGGIRVGQWYFPDWKAGGHGLTNVTKALAESVNTFFYAIGGGYDRIVGLGLDRIISYARRFGLGAPLGVDLPGEAAGFLPTAQWKKQTRSETWYIGDTYHLSIGQGDLLVTPLQIAAMTAVVASGGELLRPRLVNALTSADGSRQNIEPDVLNPQVVSKKTIDVVRQGMRQAVTDGSARSLSNLPVAVAAKTGTAQWSSSQPNHAWFTSFAPYKDPQLVVTVVIEEGGEGSTTAAPVAARIYGWYFGPGGPGRK